MLQNFGILSYGGRVAKQPMFCRRFVRAIEYVKIWMLYAILFYGALELIDLLDGNTFYVKNRIILASIETTQHKKKTDIRTQTRADITFKTWLRDNYAKAKKKKQNIRAMMRQYEHFSKRRLPVFRENVSV